MKIFNNNFLDKNKPIHINSVLHPAGGYVAKPKSSIIHWEKSRGEERLKKLTRGTGYVAIPEGNAVTCTESIHAKY